MASTTISTITAPAALQISNEPPEAGALTTSAASLTATTPARVRAPKPPDETENKAIVQCMRAWNYAYKKKIAEIDDGESDWPAEKAANEAYLRETPPLSGHKNICDFIACINFASMTDIVTHRSASHYLANARVALSAICHLPKPLDGEPKPVGRPSKTAPQNPREPGEIK